MTAVFGITGWKNSGKTTLVSALVKEFTRRGLRVSTVKHAHESYSLDHEGTDSYSHRAAGAAEVALVSQKRWAVMHEVQSEAEAPTLDSILHKLSPCDLVLVEGFKASSIPKIECIRAESAKGEAIWRSNATVVAVASDAPIAVDGQVLLELKAIDKIADFISEQTGLQE